MLKKKNIITASAVLALGLGAVGTATNSQTADAASGVKRTIMSKSVVYNHSGKSTGKKIATYKKVNTYGKKVKIKNKKYYKIGKNRYVKAVNIDGTSRTLYHNAYVYNNQGKRVNRNIKLISGTTHSTYGKAANINSKKMYRIGKNQYVKLANFTYTPKKATANTTSSNSNYEEVSPGVFVEKSSSTPKTTTKSTTSKKNTTKTTTTKKQSSVDKGWSDALKKAQKQMSDTLNKKSTSSNKSNSNSGYTEVSDGVYVENTPAPQKFNESDKQTIKNDFLNAVNNWREKQGLKPFTTINWLSNGAQQRADEEVKVFSQTHDITHKRPNGDSFTTAFTNPTAVQGEINSWKGFYKADPTGVGQERFEDFVYNDADSNWGHKKILMQNLNNPAIGIGVSSMIKGDKVYLILYADTADLN